MSNSIGPDETANYEPCHQDLHCFQKPIVIAYDNERVNQSVTGILRPFFSCRLKGNYIESYLT